MSPLGSPFAGTAWFVDGIANLQKAELQTQIALSSGYQVNTAADAPAQTPELIELGSALGIQQDYQAHLGGVQTEANSADQALQQSITLMQSAISLATQAASSTATAATDQTLAQDIQGIQQQMIGIANTQVAGRYIFGGDQDQSAPYQYNAAAADGTGVTALTAQTNSRTIINPQGQTVFQPLSAQQIFDPVNAAGNPAPNNTFFALQTLVTDLQAGNQANIANDIAALQTSSSYVIQQQAYYGGAEKLVTQEQSNAANQITLLQTQIGGIRDTNLAQAATDLTQESTDQQAAMGAQAEITQMKNLFDYLG